METSDAGRFGNAGYESLGTSCKKSQHHQRVLRGVWLGLFSTLLVIVLLPERQAGSAGKRLSQRQKGTSSSKITLINTTRRSFARNNTLDADFVKVVANLTFEGCSRTFKQEGEEQSTFVSAVCTVFDIPRDAVRMKRFDPLERMRRLSVVVVIRIPEHLAIGLVVKGKKQAVVALEAALRQHGLKFSRMISNFYAVGGKL
uniref:Uncharacterized protein n=1 Tax=Tetraselmis sp. GSL018 TaxID=582737 RepID=A0A061RNH9_9CHLO